MNINLEDRRPVWIALSDFYLDTELQDFTFKYIVRTIQESPYSLDEVKKIDKYEVFPVLQHNLLSMTGEWAGFDEDWLCESVENNVASSGRLQKIRLELMYARYKWMCDDYWEEVEKLYRRNNLNPC